MTIKAGDLVMVVRPALCCGSTDSLGRVYVVDQKTVGHYTCCGCGWFGAIACADVRGGIDDGQSIESYDVRRLIRIDPPAEPLSVFDRVEEPA